MNDGTLRPFVRALVVALALVSAPAAAQQPPVTTPQEPAPPEHAVADDENSWALAVLIGAGVCLAVGIGGGLRAARGPLRTLLEGRSGRRPPHPVLARPAPDDSQAGYFSPFAQPGVRVREASDSASPEEAVASGPERALAGEVEAGLDEMAAQDEMESFAGEEPQDDAAQPPIEGRRESEPAASAMLEAAQVESALEMESEPVAELGPAHESAADEPDQLAEGERTTLSPMVEPELLVVEEPRATPGDVPELEPPHAEEQEEIAEASRGAAPEAQDEARVDERAAKPESEDAIPPEADGAAENAPAVPAAVPEPEPAAEEGPTPVEEKAGEPAVADRPAPRARKKPAKPRSKRAASKAKEGAPPAEPKPSRRRSPRSPPG